MTNSKTTKRALLTSSISLLLCFAMLIGTTFAWFTDSAVSANNVIKAGNLDIDVQYTLDGENWTKLDGAKDLFQNGLWEPGHTEIVALKIENNGSLALKYNANMNIVSEKIGKNKDGGEIKLSDILTVSTLTQAANDWGDIALKLAFNGENRVGYETTTKFNEAILEADQELFPGDAHYLIVKVDMAETVGNEANAKNKNSAPSITFGINVLATQYTYEKDSFGNQYDKDATYSVNTFEDLQEAIESAADGDVIALGDDIKGNLNLVQKPNTKFVIDGNGNTIEGNITIDGKSATYTTAGVVIQNVNFKGAMSAINGDACIRLGDGTTATRYTCNVTVKNCTFDVPGAVGIKSYTGGDKNLKIIGCTATTNAHSLAQLKGVDGVLVEDCIVYSKNGINFNNSDNVTVDGCTVDTEGYAVRFGESPNSTVENYAITNCILSSANDGGDATIVLRAGATDANLTLTNTTVKGNPEMSGDDSANIVIQ